MHIKRIYPVLFLISLILTSSAASGSVKLEPGDTEADVVRKASGVRPSDRQLKWQSLEYTAFIHFGMNTFTGKEWGDGTEDPALFNPSEFDAKQWARTLKDAGFKLVILTAKHHDGFCLWPSKYTEHSVKNSPWRGGNGDVVREVSDACRDAGLKFGVYLSPWDRHERSFGKPKYSEYYKNQLRELLTEYGDISEVWMDGACDWMSDIRCRSKKYDWKGIFSLVRELQPGAVISISGPDVRWVGNEAGRGRDSEWSVQPGGIKAADPDLGSIPRLLEAAKTGESLRWHPAQTDTSIRPGWFYHENEDGSVKSLFDLVEIYFNSVGGNSQLLLNIPPDKRGLIHENDAARLLEFRELLDDFFDDDLALGCRASSPDSRGQDETLAANTVDGNTNTFWSTSPGVNSASIEYDLGAPAEFNIVSVSEFIALGQQVESFAIDALDGDNWVEITAATTIGHKRLLRFDTVTARKVRLRIIDSRGVPAISGFSLYHHQWPGPEKADALPPLPAGKKFKLVWRDEFDGVTLDTYKWETVDGKRRDGWWSGDAVSLDGNGNMRIRTYRDGGKYIDGCARTRGRFEHAYGYYAARVRLQQTHGHWSAFWLYNASVGNIGNGSADGAEIDIYEKNSLDNIVLHNIHWDGYGPDHRRVGSETNAHNIMKGFHTFGLLWAPDFYAFYIDGVETWRTTADGVCSEPLYIKLSDEIGEWAGDIATANLPDDFLIDYVRVYDIVDE